MNRHSERPDTPPAQSQPVLWWQLINEMEAYSAATDMGLAGMWGDVHTGDYIAARTRFDEVKANHPAPTPTINRYRLTVMTVHGRDRTDLGHVLTLDAVMTTIRSHAESLAVEHGSWRGEFDGLHYDNGDECLTLTVSFYDGVRIHYTAVLDPLPQVTTPRP
ncbi:hypothetical protein [Rhodococcus sp. IEGM 1318]|uniref:hypothetical protein n=1 Tax=Rhodococcus sp. IEGM 1318 TaxID=3082226 RepID=UPI0029534099|nr:hypothetical protein [Rhodococcus sp. IEGM 1318]MDV8003630.1 hypothetical protein [Rhodococcus sp. IEGM 1318]